jgi:hypothetical protein
MAASHPNLFHPPGADESEIRKLVVNHFLQDRVVLQWRPAAREDISTPNTIEIVVFSSFFQCGFSLPACDFLRGLLDHYQIELIHLNPNSILQIVVFIHLCEAFLGISPNFPLFKIYFFLKYQLSAADRKVIRGVGLQTRPPASLLDIPLKTSLQGWPLNPNSILQIVVFIHLCEAFLGISPNFPLFKIYFFLKYQLSAAD